MSTLAINNAMDKASHRTGEARSLDRTDKSVKAIAVGLLVAKVQVLNSVMPLNVAHWLTPTIDVTGVPVTACH